MPLYFNTVGNNKILFEHLMPFCATFSYGIVLKFDTYQFFTKINKYVRYEYDTPVQKGTSLEIFRTGAR